MSASPVAAAGVLAEVREALMRVVDPCSIATGIPLTLFEMGMVEEIAVKDGRVTITLVLTSPVCWQAGNIIQAVETSVGRVPGIASVACTVNHDSAWLPGRMDPGARLRLRAARPVDQPVASRRPVGVPGSAP
jgi:metal-sulfur cluster biosynthetic enzyme